jgi:hypothetical protein
VINSSLGAIVDIYIGVERKFRLTRAGKTGPGRILPIRTWPEETQDNKLDEPV